MNFNMNIPGLKDVEVMKMEEIGDRIALYVQLPKYTYPRPVYKKHRRFTIIVYRRSII